MSAKMGKYGVSDWDFKFHNGDIIHINTVKRETFAYKADGTVNIIIQDAILNSKFIKLFNNGELVKSLTQTHSMRDIETGELFHLEEIYEYIKVQRCYLRSSSSDFSVVDIYLTYNRKG